MVIDPVCKMTVEPAKGTKMEYGGQMYYFCSEHCRKQFAAHPVRYRMKNPDGGHGGHRHVRNLYLRARVRFHRAGHD